MTTQSHSTHDALRALYGDGVWEITKADSLREKVQDIATSSQRPKTKLVRVSLAAAPVVATKTKENAPLVAAKVKDRSAVATAKVKEGMVALKKRSTKDFDFVAEQVVSKADDEKRQVYGWVSVTEIDGKPVVDRQNDYVTIEEIEKAAHDYLTTSRDGGDMHTQRGVSRLIESLVVTPEKKEILGLPEDTPTGWWCGFQVEDPKVWEAVKKGERPAFSIHGRAQRISKEMS